MKTYIWNTEYDVMVANETNVYNARVLLISKIKNDLDKQLKEYEDKQRKLELENPYYEGTTIDFWVSFAHKYAEEKIEIINGEPDQEVEFHGCLIFHHANE